MRISDIFLIAISTLWQQKVRTLLTTLGVVFGSLVLAASLSINDGVQKTIDRFVAQNDALRKIDVYPKWSGDESEDSRLAIEGKVSDATRERVNKSIGYFKSQVRAGNPKTPLTIELLGKLATLPHVEDVVPSMWQFGFATIDGDSQAIVATAARPHDAACQHRLLAGKMFDSAQSKQALVSEYLLYRLGVDEKDLASAVGKKLRLEVRASRPQLGFALNLGHPNNSDATRTEMTALAKIQDKLPSMLENFELTPQELAALKKVLNAVEPTKDQSVAEEYEIVGVVRLMTDEERQTWDPLRAEGDVVLPERTAAELEYRLPNVAARGLDRAIVVVDQDENIKPVVEQIGSLGLNVNSAIEYVEQQRLMYLLIFGGMTLVAAVAMLVAALGIANTMLISVLERTREIGIMKAVGARNGQLQMIFVVEGALIGLVGSVLGLLLAWAISFPGDAWVRSKATHDLKFKIDEALFVFPVWLILIVLSFAVVVTVVAAIYPARRAARIDPVAALRHE